MKVYGITAGFPNEERYGLTLQARRPVLSAPSNIAEGDGRKTTADDTRILCISQGSVCELETQMMLAGSLGFIEKGTLEPIREDIAEIERM